MIALREGGARDIDEVMLVMVEAFDAAYGEAWNRGQCLGLFDLPGVWLLLASVDGVPAGFALSRVIMDEAELLLIGVRPTMRRAGVGKALLKQTIKVARAKGAARVHLEMRDGNTAILLYKQLGFAQIGRRAGYYRGPDGQLFDALTLSYSTLHN